MQAPTYQPAHVRAGALLLLAIAFGCFIAYGSLVPLRFNPVPFDQAVAQFRAIPYLRLGVASRADWVANILLYMPLSFLLVGAFTANARAAFLTAIGTAAAMAFCMLLAVSVEFAQIFFPPRTVSQNDLIAEGIGTILGAVIWLRFGRRLAGLWWQLLQGGPTARRAFVLLYLIAYLAISLFPYDFLVSRAELADKLASPGAWAPLVAGSCGDTLHCGVKLLAEVLVAAPLGFLLRMASPGRSSLGLASAFAWGALWGLAIEGLQLFVASGVTQGISVLTRAVGAAWGLALFRYLRWDWAARHRRQLRTLALVGLPLHMALLLALNGILAKAWQPLWLARERLDSVHFLPFYYHYFTTETEAMFSALAVAGAYAPLGLAAWLLRGGRDGKSGAGLALLLGIGSALCIETLKLFVPAERPDPTNILISAAAACVTCLLVNHVARASSRDAVPYPAPARREQTARVGGWRLAAAASLAVLLASGVTGWLIASPERETYVDESKLAQLPPPEELPLVKFRNFRYTHPRLPHPTLADIELLRRDNPSFLRQQEARARGGGGDMQAVALTDLANPGSQDLALLHRRLMSLGFDWRGQEQVKPLAVAYDWLYSYWTPEQRAELTDKVAQGCDYEIEVIRKERLSPYNVILYNSPLQALMACAIVLYGEHARGEPVMSFTYDYWKNRVLPVWRQVMGRHGGWHEGGEYVGIGVGQAIYQLPAMWRQATGEDPFLTEPGIRGFLDFLVYRVRPDGTHFRWGDAAAFDRQIPDAVPLAIEIGHRAAYTLNRPPRAVVPTAWPWGPLSNPMLEDAHAVTGLPLAAYFDGIGMIVARSDWSPDATYVTFKAGDNYWSHSHLDQGSFTIYKGGALAIDSGLYGPAYGSDHHMNYTYQTVAHNAVTVTDPEDRVPAPGQDKPRPIANDGGQRRVGSGWGVEAAPLDLAEWEAKRETYHTATIERLLNQDGLVVATADLTPAYTNRLSGRGTFSHRTRRVESYRRVFGYDLIDDVIVVFDHVKATNPSFRKRWLLHTQERPSLAGNRFSVAVSPYDKPGYSGGQLLGHVLLPREAGITAIGGRGLEFFVDGQNYDEQGKLREITRKRGPGRAELGEWRIEISPAHDAEADQFLVVMLPALLGDSPAHRIRSIEAEGWVGCEVIGPTRTTRWLFSPDASKVRVEVDRGSGSEVHELQVTP